MHETTTSDRKSFGPGGDFFLLRLARFSRVTTFSFVFLNSLRYSLMVSTRLRSPSIIMSPLQLVTFERVSSYFETSQALTRLAIKQSINPGTSNSSLVYLEWSIFQSSGMSLTALRGSDSGCVLGWRARSEQFRRPCREFNDYTIISFCNCAGDGFFVNTWVLNPSDWINYGFESSDWLIASPY